VPCGREREKRGGVLPPSSSSERRASSPPRSDKGKRKAKIKERTRSLLIRRAKGKKTRGPILKTSRWEKFLPYQSQGVGGSPTTPPKKDLYCCGDERRGDEPALKRSRCFSRSKKGGGEDNSALKIEEGKGSLFLTN